MDAACSRPWQVETGLGRASVFQAEERVLGFEPLDDRGRGAHPSEEFLQDVVVDQRQAHILVPARLPGLGVDFAQQVEPRPFRRGRLTVLAFRDRGLPGRARGLINCRGFGTSGTGV